MENSKPFLEKVEDIHCKAYPRAISISVFSNLYTKLPHLNLISVLYNIIDFAFKGYEKNTLSFLGKSCFVS